MSLDMHLACETCKEHICIGQATHPGILWNDSKTIKALQRFLFKHEHLMMTGPHDLHFVYEHYASEFIGWTELEPECDL